MWFKRVGLVKYAPKGENPVYFEIIEEIKEGYMRVIDESGEDYLYPQSYFILVKLPREVKEALIDI